MDGIPPLRARRTGFLKNLLTDIAGVRVGHADDAALASGVTAIIFDSPAVASIDVRGGGPGTRDERAARPENTVEAIDAIALSGGSALGLDAAGGVQAWLAEQGRGLNPRGGHSDRPRRDLLRSAQRRRQGLGTLSALSRSRLCRGAAASGDFALGSVGAGLGATTANFKGGLGSASAQTDGGVTVAALAVVNAVGSVTVGDGPWFWAAPFEIGGEFGGRGLPPSFTPDMLAARLKGGAGRDVCGKHHAGGRRHRRHADQGAGQAARDDRADRHGPRDLSGACADSTATWCLPPRPARSRSIRCSASPNSAWSPPTRRPRDRARRPCGDRATLPGRAAGVEGSLRLGRSDPKRNVAGSRRFRR